jgi:fumarate hydratase class II
LLPDAIADAIEASALKVANGMHAEQFPTPRPARAQLNMNANEVIAKLATQALASRTRTIT